MARYKQLLFYAAKLPPMSADQHKPENKVEGCVSQVGEGVGVVGGCVWWWAGAECAFLGKQAGRHRLTVSSRAVLSMHSSTSLESSCSSVPVCQCEPPLLLLLMRCCCC